MALRVLFLATKCVLDRRSGAAVEMKTVLECLAEAGFACYSITMTRFDGGGAYPLTRMIGDYADPRYKHYFLEASHYGVCHWLYYTESTVPEDIRRDEIVRFGQGVARRLDHVQPDLVITAGQGPVAEALHRLVRQKGARSVFYLANPSYTDANAFRDFDHVLCPTSTLADYYRERLGIAPGVLRNVFARDQFVPPGPGELERRRQRGFVTLVNPSPEKGATVFFELVRLAARERPDLRFAAVEARTSRQAWCERGRDPVELGNLYWLRNRADMRPVLRRTGVLLFPSLWFEAAGRLPVEAQLSGIPVIASRRGGLAEQLNGGGYLMDPPPENLRDFLRVPAPDEVRPWLERVTALLDDPVGYADAADRARAAAAPFHPDNRGADLVEEFRALLA